MPRKVDEDGRRKVKASRNKKGMFIYCRLVLEREVARVCDDFKGFGALVREIGNRIKLLSCSCSVQLALITELSNLKNVVVHDMPTSVTDAFTRHSECFNKVCS